ncbi:MAG: isoleucine--tRNA ligase [Patescibacteria group bacterium]
MSDKKEKKAFTPPTTSANQPAPANAFVAMEETILDFWEQADVFKKSIDKKAPNGSFVFFEGPPTANGMPGIHHVLARAFKDVMPRFKTMNGFRVERKAGWDTHGLPVELQVEKQLGISGKPDIEKYGIKEFNEKCKESVWVYLDEWQKLTRRIAFWVDMEHPYITYDNTYIESLWWILKEMDKKSLVYKGHKVVPHCPRCGTALSSHEVAQGYKLTKDNSVYLKFKVTVGNDFVKPGDFILAWTTTPWTLPGNVALAVGKDIEYVKVYRQVGEVGANYILAKSIFENTIEGIGKEFSGVRSIAAGEIPPVVNLISESKGSDLLDLEYEPLFEIPAIRAEEIKSGKKAYRVVPANFVTTSDGTGVVHTAVMYGEDDYDLGEAVGLPKVHTVDEGGLFTNDLSAYGLNAKFVKSAGTEKIILDYLKENKILFKEEIYEHDYPFCWRCDTPLLYYAKDSWFIAMSTLKEELLENNKTINWIPEHIKEGRFGEWLGNVKDWAISRERYWGTPLPIWECEKCQKHRVIGSVEELAELSGQKVTIKSDIHRPEIDAYEMTCADCGGKMKRVKEVFDCWFDSGAMPYAQHHYPFENRDLIDKNEQFPAEFICEAIDQTRGWFYTLLAISTTLGKGAPYKNVICLGHINDKFGKKMSKSKGNIISPWEVISQYGVDAVRQHMFTINQPGEGKRYDLDDVKDVFRKNIMLLWNVYKFYEMYATSEKSEAEKPESQNVLDLWILAKFSVLVKGLTTDLNTYHIYEAARRLPEFIDELSTWYLRRSRDRFKSDDEADKNNALATTRYVLTELAKLMAPFMPFIAENLWQKMSAYNFEDKNASVHLEKWPESDETDYTKLLADMELTRKIVELGLAKRDEAGIKIRQMLAKITVKVKTEITPEYIELLKDELNVAGVEFIESAEDKIELELDTFITPELKEEGLKRELIRFVNMLRKEGNLNINDETNIYLVGAGEELKTALLNKKADIMKDTLSADINCVDAMPEVLVSKEIKIDDVKLSLGLIKQENQLGEEKAPS